MAYPRELNLDPDTELELVNYLETVLHDHYGERSGFIQDLKRWQRDYWATPSTKVATFPFHGAATIIVPLNAIAIEAIHARVMTMMFGLPNQFVSAQAVSGPWEPVEKAFERHMDWELMNNIKAKRVFGDCYLEMEKYGSGVALVDYEKKVKYAIREIDGVEYEVEIVTKQGATIDAVANSRFLMPFHEQEPNESPWIAIEHSAGEYDLIQYEKAGLFRKGTVIDISEDNPAKLKPFLMNQATTNDGFSTGSQTTEQQQELENTKPSFGSKLDWVEVRMAFDVDKSRRMKEIIVHFHRPSRTIMSIRYNWHYDLDRNVVLGQYFPVEHRWRGIGICKMNEQFQREVTTQHRQRLDNGLLANMRMIVVSRLSGYGPKEPIFPGKMWLVDDTTHINTIQMGEVYPSSYQNEQSTLIYSQQRTGINEVTLGMPQVGTPGTATSDLARIQEGNKKFDYMFDNMKVFTNDVIVRVAAVIQQFGPRRVEYYDTVEGGQLVKAFFQMPTMFVKEGLLISLKAAGAQRNKIIDRQDWQQIAAFLQQYFQNLMMLAQFSGNQELMMMILSKALLASNEGMRQILETYDVRNIDRMLVTEIERMLNNGPNGAGPEQAGPGQPSGVVSPNPMDFLNSAFGVVNGSGNGEANYIPAGRGGF